MRGHGVQLRALTATLVCAIIGAGFPSYAHERMRPVNPWDAVFGKVRKAITLQAGLGPIHHTITTRSPVAQRWFDQGLAQLFGFAHEDAIRSFQKALTIDPTMAMAYWGIAYAYGPNINLAMSARAADQANRAIAQAKQLASNASQSEQDYIAALAVRYSDDPTVQPLGPKSRQQINEGYYAAMKRLMATYPEDRNAATLAAEAGMDLLPWKLWTNRGDPTLPVTIEVKKILEDVLAKDPNHVGALHYYIHAVEGSRDPNAGLAAAERIKWLAWGQPHLVHAASHIYARNGDWGAAMISGEDATVQDRLYQQRIGTKDLYVLAHGNHNIHFLVSVLAMGGRKTATLAEARILHASVAPYVNALPALEYLMPYDLLMAVRFHEWRQVLTYPRPASKLKATTALWHYARGIAQASSGHIDLARSELEALKQQLLLPEFADGYYLGFNKAIDILNIAALTLAAKIAYASKDLTEATALLTTAVKQQDALNYDEPPPWYYPIRESLGAVLLRQGKAAEAEETFRADLLDYPNNGRSLFGLQQALEARGKSTTEINAQYSRAWKSADSVLTIDSLF